MLQAIVADHDVASGVDQKLGGRRAVAADRDGHSSPARKQYRLIADDGRIVARTDEPHASGRASIAACDDAWLEARFAEAGRQPADQRRLARAAHAEVSDHDHRQRHHGRFAQAFGV